MSTDFKCKLVRDSRLNSITNELVYSVQSGAAQSTYQNYPSTSSSPTNISFNIQPPSESTVMDRNVLLRMQVTFQITIPNNQPNIAVGTNVFQYGLREAFQAFPANSLITTATATINNVSVSLNQQDIFPALLRMLDNEELQKYQAMTPVYLDNYKQYQDAEVAVNNPLAAYTNGVSQKYSLPRGCHPLDNVVILATGNGHGGGDTNPVKLDNDNAFTITITATFTEPLFISPFLFSGLPQNDAGILGVNNFNLVLNLDSQMKRFWSSGLVSSAGGINYSLAMTANPVATLYVNYLTLQTTQLVETKNILPYIDLPRYITGQNNTNNINAGASGDITIQNIQLQQIPDRFIIFARKPLANQTVFDSSSFLPINSISCNFNNCSGLLSSISPYQLWQLSVANGCKMNWYEWSGQVNGYRAANPSNSTIPTVGSLLVINPARDLSLPPYLAPGSQGQFSFQMSLNVTNNDLSNFAPEIVIITVNSGLFEVQAGKSAIYTALLSMDKVLATNEESKAESFSKDEHEVRKLGDGLVNVHAHHKLHHNRHHKKLMHEIENHQFGAGRSGGKMMKHSKLSKYCA